MSADTSTLSLVGHVGGSVTDKLPLLESEMPLSLQQQHHTDIRTESQAANALLGDVSDHKEAGGTQTQVSWKLEAGPHEMTSLEVIILWLNTGENYNKWRRGTCSKKDVGEIVSVFLAQNGHPGRSSAYYLSHLLSFSLLSYLSPPHRSPSPYPALTSMSPSFVSPLSGFSAICSGFLVSSQCMTLGAAVDIFEIVF